MKANWIGHILRSNCRLNHVIEVSNNNNNKFVHFCTTQFAKH